MEPITLVIAILGLLIGLFGLFLFGTAVMGINLDRGGFRSAAGTGPTTLGTSWIQPVLDFIKWLIQQLPDLSPQRKLQLFAGIILLAIGSAMLIFAIAALMSGGTGPDEGTPSPSPSVSTSPSSG